METSEQMNEEQYQAYLDSLPLSVLVNHYDMEVIIGKWSPDWPEYLPYKVYEGEDIKDENFLNEIEEAIWGKREPVVETPRVIFTEEEERQIREELGF